MIARQKDLGEFTLSKVGLPNVQIVAGGGLDDVFQEGPEINRLALGATFLCLLAVLNAKCVIAATKNVLLTMKLQHSDVSGSGFVDYGSAVTKTINDGAVENDTLDLPVDLSGVKQYIKILAKANPSAATVDTADISVVALFGGSDTLPV